MTHMIKAQQGETEKQRLSIGCGKEEGGGEDREIEYSSQSSFLVEIFLDQSIQHHKHHQTSQVRNEQASSEWVASYIHQAAFEQRIQWKEDGLRQIIAKLRYSHVVAGIPVVPGLPQSVDGLVLPGKVWEHK